MPRVQLPATTPKRRAWNQGRIIGQKRPLLPKQVWAIRARLELAGNLRDLALFNVAIDSKLRGCDLVKLAISDLVKDERVRELADEIIKAQRQLPPLRQIGIMPDLNTAHRAVPVIKDLGGVVLSGRHGLMPPS